MAKSKTRLKKPIVANPSYTVTQVDNRGQATYPSTPTVKRKLQLPNYDINLKPSVTASNTPEAIAKKNTDALRKKGYSEKVLNYGRKANEYFENGLSNTLQAVGPPVLGTSLAALDIVNDLNRKEYAQVPVDALSGYLKIPFGTKTIPASDIFSKPSVVKKMLPLGRGIDAAEAVYSFKKAKDYSDSTEMYKNQQLYSDSLRDELQKKVQNQEYQPNTKGEQKFGNGGPINKKVVIPPTPYTVTAVDANSVRQAAPRLTTPPPSPMRISTKPQVKRRDSLIDAQIKYVQANKSKNDTLNYAVIDKNSNNIVYVDRNGKRIKNEPIITGVDSGDVTTAPSQQEYYKSDLKDKYKDYYDYLDQIKQKITPAGVFSTKLITNYTEPIGLKNKIKKIIDKDAWQEAKNHRIESYGPTGQLLTLTDEEGKESSKAIHGTGYMNRIAALKDTTNKTSRNMSNGCINLDGTSCGFSTLKDNSKVYILPERDTLIPYTKPVKLEYGGKVTSLKNTNINDYTMRKYKNGGGLRKCEDGGALDPSDAAISKVLAFRNRSREAMQRAMDPNQPSLQSNTMGEPRLQNLPNSQRSTHYMAYDLDKTGGNPVVYPTINMTPSGLKYNGFEGARNAGNVMPMPSNRVADMFSDTGYKVATGMNKRELGGYVRNLGIINDERNWLAPKAPPVSNKKSMGVDVYGVSAGNVKFGIGGDTEGEEEKDFRDNINGFAQNSGEDNGEQKDKNNLFKDTTNGQLSDGLGMAASLASSVMPLSDAGQYGRYDATDRGKMGISSALQGASMGAKLGPAGAVVGAVVGGVAGVVMAKKRERDKAKQVAKDQAAYQDRAASTLNFNNNVGVDNTAMYADGGLMKRPLAAAMMNRQNSNMKPMSENATEVKGRSHAEGGEALPDLGAEVEAGETTEGSYVFSKKLGFADLHRPLARAMGKIEKKPMTPDRVNALRLLQGKVEMLKAQQEQVRKQLNLA